MRVRHVQVSRAHTRCSYFLLKHVFGQLHFPIVTSLVYYAFRSVSNTLLSVFIFPPVFGDTIYIQVILQ